MAKGRSLSGRVDQPGAARHRWLSPICTSSVRCSASAGATSNTTVPPFVEPFEMPTSRTSAPLTRNASGVVAVDSSNSDRTGFVEGSGCDCGDNPRYHRAASTGTGPDAQTIACASTATTARRSERGTPVVPEALGCAGYLALDERSALGELVLSPTRTGVQLGAPSAFARSLPTGEPSREAISPLPQVDNS